MNAEQNAKVQTFAAIIATADAHVPDWTDFDPFAIPYNKFKTRYATIPGILAQQQTTTTGTTEAKKAIRQLVNAHAIRIGNTLGLYGRLNNNLQLTADAALSPTDVTQMREKALVGHVTKLLSMASALPAAGLTELSLSPAYITETESALSNFTAVLGTPRHKQAEAKRGTEELDGIIEELMDILEDELDPAIAVLQYTKPDFAGEYLTAREIVDAGTATRELSVIVSDQQSGQTIEGAQAVIVPGNIEKETGPSGTFYINNMDEGDYQMQVSANGYSTVSIPFHITDGQATVVNVPMGQLNFPGS